MKLKELRAVIDELDDKYEEELDVVLDIEPKSGAEYLVDIGEIYKSRMHEGKIKIEPVIELDTHKEPKRMVLESNLYSGIIDIRCPNCNAILNGRDSFCKHCGQPLYTREETHEYIAEKYRKSFKERREARKAARNKKKEK